jgi:PEGA domain/Protein kinase domain
LRVDALNARRFNVTIRGPSSRSFSLHTEPSGTAPPDAFGPFRVLHQIGAGTLGPVFRAYDAERERLVAVKLFNLDLPPEKGHQLVAEFERLIAADLTHPALASPLATGITGVSAFLAQDYVAAESLDLSVREYGPAPPAEALRVAAQLAGALDFAAVVNISHGALHPRDVLMSSDDTRLTGMGVAHALETVGVTAPIRRPYSPPERIAGAAWNRRADVFSLAALIHELLWARRVSGTGARAAESLTEIEGGDLARLRATFARALAENPDDRYETALEFAEALKEAFPAIVLAPPAAVDRRSRKARSGASVERNGGKASEKQVTTRVEPRLPLETELEIAMVRETGTGDILDAFRTEHASESDVRAGASDDVKEPVRVSRTEAVPFRSETTTAVGRDAGSAERTAPAPSPIEPVRRAAGTPAAQAVALSGHEPEFLSVLERSRSAVWPLVLALVVGIAIGFAAGYGTGSQRQNSATANNSTGREFTDGTVAESAKAAPPAATPDPDKTTAKPAAKVSPPAPQPPAEPESGRLLVRSTPGNASVSIDGHDAGRTPATVRDLAFGAHHVRVTRDGYAALDRRVVVTASRPATSIDFELVREKAAVPEPRRAPAAAPPVPSASAATGPGPLRVESRPAGASVYLDGRLVGVTPLSLPAVPAGDHTIRLQLDGYQPWASSVQVSSAEANRVTASLER